MKITIQDQVQVEKEINIEFPIYRKHILDNSIIFMKVESVEKEISIDIHDDEQKAGIEIEKPSFFGSEDYLLGKGEYKSSEEEFAEALKVLKSIIWSI